MRCSSCGQFKKGSLREFNDGRKTLYLCDFCYAEREWKLKEEVVVKKPSIIENAVDFLLRLFRIKKS